MLTFSGERSIWRPNAKQLTAYINAALYSCKVYYDFFIRCMKQLAAIDLQWYGFASFVKL